MAMPLPMPAPTISPPISPGPDGGRHTAQPGHAQPGRTQHLRHQTGHVGEGGRARRSLALRRHTPRDPAGSAPPRPGWSRRQPGWRPPSHRRRIPGRVPGRHRHVIRRVCHACGRCAALRHWATPARTPIHSTLPHHAWGIDNAMTAAHPPSRSAAGRRALPRLRRTPPRPHARRPAAAARGQPRLPAGAGADPRLSQPDRAFLPGLRAPGEPEDVPVFVEHAIRTTGDAVQKPPPGGDRRQGPVAKEIHEALADGRIDMAVHSLKDLEPRCPPASCWPARWPARDARDVLIRPRRHSCRRGESLRLPADRRGGSARRRSAARRRCCTAGRTCASA